MKKLSFFLISCFILQVTAQSNFTAKQWQDDLTFLQQTVHKDYPFLFKKTTATSFDSAVKSLHKQIPKLEEHERSLGIARIIGMFKYGHTRMGWRNNPVKIRQLPLNLYHFSDGIYVQGVHQDYADVLGAKVVAVGSMPIKQALKAIYPVVPVENEQFFKAYGLLYLASPEVLHAQGVISKLSDTVEFTLEKDGKLIKRSFKALSAGQHVPGTYRLCTAKRGVVRYPRPA